MNNLEKAKELESKFEKFIVRDYYSLSSIKQIKLEAKELLKEIKKGCGKNYEYKEGYPHIPCGCTQGGLLRLCQECQEAIKICEEILK